ncbi:MAG TPA: hypothetical protein DCZ94_19800 [Lentisphaeria bacterium]|nr:MAG: hypothetical protein A2X48_22365 [Lentisphaerae bacterium GWF2_49_21]HBC89190.1 hypothetical protein [Lentisphaeria bacterium]
MSIYKSDIDAAKNNWDTFWNGTNKRPMLSAVLPRKGKTPVEKPPYAAGHDGNFAPVLDQICGWVETHEFLGEAIPFHYLEFAADHFSILLGADLVFPGEGGGWPLHFVNSWEKTELSFKRHGKWWRRTVDFAEAIKKRFGDDIMIASPTFVANLDALVAVRGANDVLLDMMDQPALIRRALDQVLKSYKEILAEYEILFEYKRLGSITRHGIYSKGRINVPQCDLSCMLSGEMFREFVLPYLKAEMECYDAVEYHLDGPDAIRHLEDLCSIDKLGVIQWVSGAGNEKKDWTWLHDKIDALGKGQILWANPELAVSYAKKYKSRKLFFLLSVKSRQEFDDCTGLLEETWSMKT